MFLKASRLTCCPDGKSECPEQRHNCLVFCVIKHLLYSSFIWNYICFKCVLCTWKGILLKMQYFLNNAITKGKASLHALKKETMKTYRKDFTGKKLYLTVWSTYKISIFISMSLPQLIIMWSHVSIVEYSLYKQVYFIFACFLALNRCNRDPNALIC